MKKKVFYILLAILLLLIVTNPSQTDFKNFIGARSFNGLQRKYNFFVLSIYNDDNRDYWGFAGNFIKSESDDSTQTRFIKSDSIFATTENIDTLKKSTPGAKLLLYQHLVKDGFYSKSYNQIVEQFSTPQAVSKLYFLVQKGKYDKSEQVFTQQFFN